MLSYVLYDRVGISYPGLAVPFMNELFPSLAEHVIPLLNHAETLFHWLMARTEVEGSLQETSINL